MGGTGCLGETGREGGGLAGEEQVPQFSVMGFRLVRLGTPTWQAYDPHPEAATHAVSSIEKPTVRAVRTWGDSGVTPGTEPAEPDRAS